MDASIRPSKPRGDAAPRLAPRGERPAGRQSARPAGPAGPATRCQVIRRSRCPTGSDRTGLEQTASQAGLLARALPPRPCSRSGRPRRGLSAGAFTAPGRGGGGKVSSRPAQAGGQRCDSAQPGVGLGCGSAGRGGARLEPSAPRARPQGPAPADEWANLVAPIRSQPPPRLAPADSARRCCPGQGMARATRGWQPRRVPALPSAARD